MSLLLPRRKLLRLAAPALVLPHRRGIAQPFPGLLARPASAYTGPTIISSVATVANTTPTTSSAINTTGANLLVFCWGQWHGVSQGATTDSQSNTWAGVTSVVDGLADTFTLVNQVASPSTSASHTFTLTSGGGPLGWFAVFALAGVVTSTNDGNNHNSTNGATSLQTTTYTPSHADSLAITMMTMALNGTGPSVNSGFTTIFTKNATASVYGGGVGYLKQHTAAALAPTWSWTTSVAASAITISWH